MTKTFNLDSEVRKSLQSGLEEELKKGASEETIKTFVDAGARLPHCISKNHPFGLPSDHPLAFKKIRKFENTEQKKESNFFLNCIGGIFNSVDTVLEAFS